LKKPKNPKTISSELDLLFDWIAYPTKLRFENTKNPKTISSELDLLFDWIAYPTKLRFENTKNPKTISSKLDYLLTGLYIQQSSALKIQLKQKNAQASLAFFFF
jgi:hypothetical protein